MQISENGDSLRNCFCGVVQLSNVHEEYTSSKRNYMLTQVKWKSQKTQQSRKSNQEVGDSRVLRNLLTNSSPFPFKVCSERIIDFHFLSAYKILRETILAAILLCLIGCYAVGTENW